MNCFAIATTERDLIFYDINSHTYTDSIIINHFPASLTTIDYHMNIKNSSQPTILCEDSLGNLFIFQAKDPYRPMFHISDLTHYMKTDSRRNYSFPRIVNNEYLTVSVISFCNLQNDWIVQVKWIDDLDFFVSCALASTRNLYIGDLNKKMEKYAVTKKCFAFFDYCKAHRSIVTGSNDGVIRFWDPFVTERAAAILRGHNSSVTHLVVDNRENHIISIDKGKNIIIWDVQTLKIIQRISHTIFDLSGQDLTICYLNPTQQRLIIGNRKLLSLSHINESYIHNERTSHIYPITKILYNPLFNVIISCDEGSTINIWNIITGEKIMHILNAHVTQFDEYNEHAVEITTMCLDESKRRLITGAHDGSLALWNFNNGHNLYRVNSNGIHAKEITTLLHENERLFVAGWSRRIRVFHLGKSVVIRQVDEFRSLHNDDILSMSIMMNILATASYDGDIILWTIETGMPFMKLNSVQDTKGAIQANFPKYFSRRRIKKFKRREADNTERLDEKKGYYNRIRQSLLNRLRTNYEISVESVLKSNIDNEFNQSTISSDYHLDQLIFLLTREINPSSATLITAGSMGWIWWWSIHVIGRLIAVFNGARKSQEHVLAMCVDEKCNLLFTSDTAGYVALWFIGDYAYKQPDSKEKQMKLIEEKNRILTYFSSNLHSNSTDIRRVGSATTLELLRGDVGKRWKLLKHTIVAWTSLPIFRYFYQNKDSEIQKTSNHIQPQSNIHHESNDSTINHVRKLDIEEKREWIQRRERLQQIIKLDRVNFIPITKKKSVETMLKNQRENLGITMPILGQYSRKYMQHRPISNFNHLQIHGGKAIIYSLLPLASSPDNIPRFTLDSDEIQNDILLEYVDTKFQDNEANEHLQQQRIDKHSMIQSNEIFLSDDKLPRIKRNQDIQICPSIKLQTNTFSLK
ncbi:unnamed protein product [Rotaria sp. Silwood1]|nr:unnamed protein product [Rotaria sp. Silwood1]CAF1572178.1 unnamed protein product [Rotaria sp. Silwood1]